MILEGKRVEGRMAGEEKKRNSEFTLLIKMIMITEKLSMKGQNV